MKMAVGRVLTRSNKCGGLTFSLDSVNYNPNDNAVKNGSKDVHKSAGELS